MSSQAQEMGLGNVVKVLKSSSMSGILFGLGLGVVLIIAANVIGIDWSSITNIPAMMCAGGLFILAGTLIGLPGALKQRSIVITVYDQGFNYKSSKANVSMRWADITSVARRYVHGRRGRVDLRQYIVNGKDGTVIPFDPTQISDGLKLGQYIEQKSLDHLLPAYFSTYESGQTVSFGPVLISSAGIGAGTQFLEWSKVQNVKISSWYFAINESGLKMSASAEVSQIPNPAVLMALIAKVAGPGVKVSGVPVAVTF